MQIRLVLFLAIGVLATLSLPAAETPAHTATPAAGASLIQGTCTVELKIGTRQYLSKMGIAVVPAKAAAEIQQVRDNQWRRRAVQSNYNDGFHNLDLDAIGGTAVKNALQTVQSDLSGNYQIHGLPPGDYLLYAQYRSRYAVAYWLLPVTIKSNQDQLTVDINTNNVKEAYNLPQDQW